MAVTLIAAFDLAQKGAVVLVRVFQDHPIYGDNIDYVESEEWNWKALDDGGVYSNFFAVANRYSRMADLIAFEQVPPRRHWGKALVTLLTLTAHKTGRSLFPVNVSTVKKGVAGHGRASKEQVEAVVKERVRDVPEDATSDLYDALAVAVWMADHMEVGE